MNEEPARKVSIIAGIAVGLLGGVIAWSAGADVRVAVGVAASALSSFAATGEIIRGKVFSPATHKREVDKANRRGTVTRDKPEPKSRK